MSAERERLAEAGAGGADWQRWGTYLSERAWGTVREDYSADGDAWTYFPFEAAHRRAYRWNEDGLAGWCDRDQTICLGLGLWNGADPILKERPFGLTNGQGNHGEDAKDYWFYTDNLPTHAYASMVYKYPHSRFPYEDLVAVNAARGADEPEYELFDALEQQWRENRYFDVVIEYAKPDPEDVLCRITATNRGPDPAPIHIVGQLWYRNTWRWDGSDVPGEPGGAPVIERTGPASARTHHPLLGGRWLSAQVCDESGGPGGSGDTGNAAARVELVFCDNETNNAALFGSANAAARTKDGINDYIVNGDASAVHRDRGSKAAAIVTAELGPGACVTVTLRFAPADLRLPFDDADMVLAARKQEADEFYTEIADGAAMELGADERLVQRQALAGLLWCKQFYHYEVREWLKGDPGEPPPPDERWTGRNSDWQHLVHRDVILMPDAWEYPWYAAWDLAFHAVTMAMIDPAFAKDQLLLLLSSITQHPHGQVPAYEWNFGDTNPPLQAWAAWQIYLLDKHVTGRRDTVFLAAAYRAISLNVMWWLNQKDQQDRGVFGGGFLGMDNVGVFDRDEPLPTGGSLAQVDGTSWMASMLLQMLEITVELAREDSGYDDMFGRWVWDGWLVANALEKGVRTVGFWNEGTQFYHDVIEFPDGSAQSLEVFSMQSLVPLLAGIAVPVAARGAVDRIQSRIASLMDVYHEPPDAVRLILGGGDGSHLMVAVVDGDRLPAILHRVLDPQQFLSNFGIRSLSRLHRDHPYSYESGGRSYEVRYLPAESDNRMFGGNSNWRGPIWMPMNFLLVQSLNAYARFYGDSLTVPDPTGSDHRVTLASACDDLAARLCSIFLRDAEGRRPVLGSNDYFQTDRHWRDLVPFYEYFDGDDGHGLGASHQTGWTATVALLLQFGGDLRFSDIGRG